MSPSDDMIASAAAYASAHGLGSLRPKQREVLCFLAGRVPTFAALPTGYGKSLCYWLPAAAWGWRVWVISPLVSLIEDQALAGAGLGVRTLAWTGGIARSNRRHLERRMQEGDWQVCLLSPERFTRWSENGTLDALRGFGLSADLYALDEMHCLEEWRGFRSGYRELAAPLRGELHRGAALLGLSASLPAREAEGWMRELCDGERCARVSDGIGRDNLVLRVVPVETEDERWLCLVSALRGLGAPRCALVYCATREETDDVSRWLTSAGFPAVAYHAGLPADLRRERSRAFRAGRLRLVCATSAFGMGIDYPHVDRVIHFSIPRDLESYWQEVGRAGRSGAPARAVAIWRRSEVVRARRMDPDERARFRALWESWAAPTCRKRALAERFGFGADDCGKCDRCDPDREAPAPWWCSPNGELAEWIRERDEVGANGEVKGTFFSGKMA